MATVSLDSPMLDERCTRLHIEKIAEDIEDWQELAPYFSLTEADEETIQNSHAHQPELRKRKMLWMWVEKNGNEATYRKMKNIFSQAEKALLADKLLEILQDAYSQSPLSAVTSFKRYLIDCYTNDGEDCQGEWPLLPNAPFVNPELLLGSQKVGIRDLLQERKVKVLLEGTAGSGKTTLTKHICQQWADGKLLNDVDLLIHLTLADPALWSAHSLEDMIPHPTAEIRKAVADTIVEQGGRQCCFVMDSWEDLPERMQKSSLFRTIFEGKKAGVALPHCSFIVTSRPIASTFVKPLVTTTVEIAGFSAEGVDSYATQYLTQQGKDPTVFITALDDNPPTRGLSSLPINAAILLHLFLTITTGLPTTQTELFRCFLLNLLFRHLVSKTDHHLRGLHDFSDLPGSVVHSFHKLCLVAHYATFADKAGFQSSQLLSSKDLHQAGLKDLSETLSLMKIHQQLTWFGYDPHYGFLHSSVRDFLCALRMSQLSAGGQVRDFKLVMSSNPMSLIPPFYAGLTKLGDEAVCECLQQIGLKPPHLFKAIPELSVAKSEAGDTHRLFLAYIHCVFEADRWDLLVKATATTRICFMWYRLSVHDLNIIFSYLLYFARICYPHSVQLVCHSCFVNDHGIESAFKSLANRARTHHSSKTGNIDILMGHNNLTHNGVGTILSGCDTFMLHRLHLDGNLHSPSSSGFTALKILCEALSSGPASQLEFLSLYDCHLTSRHAYHLLLLFTQSKKLEGLNISENQLQECVPLLLSAAISLRKMCLNGSGIGDKELLEVGLILQSNTTMRELDITSKSFENLTFEDSIGFETVSMFTEMIIAPESHSHIEKLNISDCYLPSLECDKIQRALEKFTSRRGFPMEITLYVRTNFALASVNVHTALRNILHDPKGKALLFGKT